MHIEVQVALNFVISYLYNKLPRRRVNIFGEELEKALKEKFSGHWYPGKPLKGSAFRCLKTGDPVDPVLEIAARESGVSILDVLEFVPRELAVWVDPGEVSYRIGEKGDVKILYRESWDKKSSLAMPSSIQLSNNTSNNISGVAIVGGGGGGGNGATIITEDNNNNALNTIDREVHKTFNPEARIFRPIEVCLANLSLSTTSISPPSLLTTTPTPSLHNGGSINTINGLINGVLGGGNNNGSINSIINGINNGVGGGSGSSINGVEERSLSPSPTKGSPTFLPRNTQPLTFTTATFAQTKFGSTKLKTNSKRTNRMSPTEFSNYIKQRALLQQQQQQQQQHHHSSHHSIPSSYNQQQQQQQNQHHHQQQNQHHLNNSNNNNYNTMNGVGGSRSISPSYYYNNNNHASSVSPSSPLSPQFQQQHSSSSNSSLNQQNGGNIGGGGGSGNIGQGGLPPIQQYYRWSNVDSEPTSPYHHLLVAN